MKKVCKPQHCMLITISEYGEKSAGQGNCTLNAVCSCGIQKYMYCSVFLHKAIIVHVKCTNLKKKDKRHDHVGKSKLILVVFF